MDFSDKETPMRKEDHRHRYSDNDRDDLDFSDMEKLFKKEEPSRKRDRDYEDEFDRFARDDFADYRSEPAHRGAYDRRDKSRRHQHDELDLFKKSYEYESEYDPYREERHRTRRQDDRREDRRDERYHRYGDYDLDDYYTRPPTREQHRRHRSYSDDRYYERPQRRSRRRTESPRHRDHKPRKETPEKPQEEPKV